VTPVLASSDAWSIRLARREDAPFLPEIERAASVLFEGQTDLPQFSSDDCWTAAELSKLIAKGYCLVAEQTAAPGEASAARQILGFLAAEPFQRELHIWEMDVSPAHQRRGIGAALLRGSMIDARNAGFQALTLTTFRDLAWNGPFYQRLGFTEIVDLAAHPRLAAELAAEAKSGLPPERRCAMICFL
jgi:GNAT superfamily N-acetyltransferase